MEVNPCVLIHEILLYHPLSLSHTVFNNVQSKTVAPLLDVMKQDLFGIQKAQQQKNI